MNKQNLKSAKHPKTNIEYFVGDRICIYQGRFGHNNIITIGSLWDVDGRIYVSEKETLPGTYLESVKEKITDKEYNKILRAKQLSSKYTNI